MIQALLSKYFAPVIMVIVLALSAGLVYKSWALEKEITKNKHLETTVASYKATIDTLKRAENLGREWAEKATADKLVREKELAQHMAKIEKEPSNEKVNPLLSDTVKRLYGSTP